MRRWGGDKAVEQRWYFRCELSCASLLFFIYSTRSTGVEIDGREVEDVLGGEGETRRDEVRCSRKEFKRGTRITFITREEGGKVHPGGGE